MTVLIIFLLLIGGIGYIFLNAYNALQRKAQEVRESLSNISVTTSKKISLINQLMDVVKGYQDNESLVHLTVVKETGVNAIQSTLKNANSMLVSMQSMAERYPDLKSDKQYHRLITNIENIENEVSQYRKNYNSRVKGYNTSRTSIPTVFVANALGFTEAPYLDMSMENEGELLKEFKTDDGARLNALLNTAKNNIVDGSKSIASSSKEAIDKAANASKRRVKDSNAENATFFYMLAGATPKGPVNHEDIVSFADNGDWRENVRINKTSTENWLSFDEWHTTYVIVDPETTEPTLTRSNVDEPN